MKRLVIDKKNFPFYIILAVSFVIISFLLAHHLIASYLQFKTFLFESGEFYGDRLINFSIAKTAQTYGINFFDPFSRQEMVFYQFFPYWILGFLAKLLSANPWAVANLIQIFVAPAFFMVIYVLAKKLTGSRVTALIAVFIMFAFGSLEFLITRTIGATNYGEHAIIIQFLRNTYSFSLDNFSVLFGYIALIFFIAILKDRKYSWKTGLPFIFFAAIAYNTHFLPAIFFILLFSILLIASSFYENDLRRKQNLIFIISVAAIYFFLLLFYSFRPPMLIIGLTGLVLFSYAFVIEKKKYPYYVLLASFIPMVLIAGVSVYFAKITGNSASYNDAIRMKNLYIPLLTFLVAYFPLIILSLLAAFKSDRQEVRRYYSVMLLAMFIIVYNNAFGYNNHPYRFLPYIFPLFAILSAQGLSILFRKERIISARNALAVVFAFSLILGSYFNIAFYLLYSHSTSKPVEPRVMEMANIIEKYRKINKEAVFYVDPALLTVDRLAPYTGAKFYFSSPLSFNTMFTAKRVNAVNSQLQTNDYDVINSYSRQNDLKLNYIITNRKLVGAKENLIYNKGSVLLYRINAS